MRGRCEKVYADKKRNAKVNDIEVGDRVILVQSKRNKLTTPFETEPYEAVNLEGNTVVIQREEEPRKMRNVAHMKKLNSSSGGSGGQVLGHVPVKLGVSDAGPNRFRSKMARLWDRSIDQYNSIMSD